MPKKLQPLSRNEKAAAVRVARKHRAVQPYVKGRNRAVLIEPNITDRRQSKESQQAVVGLYDYSTNKSLVALVDLEAEKVLAAEETPVQFQLDPDEQKEAERLAARDAHVKDFLSGRKMNPLTRLYFPPTAAKDDPPHRYAIVFIRPSNSERRFAVVDLSEEQVVDFLDPRETARQ
jgi:Cu2+-containing amine oxidase